MPSVNDHVGGYIAVSSYDSVKPLHVGFPLPVALRMHADSREAMGWYSMSLPRRASSLIKTTKSQQKASILRAATVGALILAGGRTVKTVVDVHLANVAMHKEYEVKLKEAQNKLNKERSAYIEARKRVQGAVTNWNTLTQKKPHTRTFYNKIASAIWGNSKNAKNTLPINTPKTPNNLKTLQTNKKLNNNLKTLQTNNKTKDSSNNLTVDDMLAITHSAASRLGGSHQMRVFAWFNLKMYCEQVMDVGVSSAHRKTLWTHFMEATPTTHTPDILRTMRAGSTSISCLRTKYIERLSSHPYPVAPLQIDESVLATDLWPIQRFFLDRALLLDIEGVEFTSFPQQYVRIANSSGNVVFLDRLTGRTRHASEVSSCKTNIRGGFLVDSIGTGKTLSAIAMCAMNPAPADHHLDSDGRPRRLPNGRMVSRATLVICPAQVCVHWAEQIKTHLADAHVNVIIISSKREHERHTYEDIMEADFVIISYNFVGHSKFKCSTEGYGSTGWAFFNDRLNHALYMTKRMRADVFVATTKLSLPHVHFWRLVVDEIHEAFLSSNTNPVLVMYFS
ncbi:SNF2 family N-terminal domain-containing protein [Pavlovales sp. CCMP2436]|nr:SNF2 family N-terminal domain-containing protein [Pavlovales sp. CCMP2436]